MSTPLKAVIFDLDDTLYPERQYALSGFRAVAKWAEAELGIPADQAYAELAGYFEAGVRGDTFNRFLEARDLPLDLHVPAMVEAYREHTPTLEPFPDTVPVLESLNGRFRLGVITQGHGSGQRRKIEALGLADYFESIVIMPNEERELWKPGHVPFERSLGELGVRAEEAVYLGDHPERDFRGARELGMLTVWVRRPEGEHAGRRPPTPAHEPDLVVVDLLEAREALLAREPA